MSNERITGGQFMVHLYVLEGRYNAIVPYVHHDIVNAPRS